MSVDILQRLEQRISERKKNKPSGSYTAKLFELGEGYQRRKIGEEAIEVITAKGVPEIASETADLLYHILVFLNNKDIPFDLICEILQDRFEVESE